MKEECLICKAPLIYLETDNVMECAICHKKENSKTRCVHGHYVCNECHMAGLDTIIGLCLAETSKNTVEIIEKMMALPFCHMHGPEHHVMVGAALLTAYKNAGGEIDLPIALTEMVNRGKSVPGGACGFWGACGAGISSGMFVSIISGSTPLKVQPFALSHKMTAKSLGAIGDIGGPRCCKRDSYLSILSAIDFVKEHFGIEMERQEIVCTHSGQNNQCIGKRCPFNRANHMKYNFYGWQTATITDSCGLTPRDYYVLLSGIWCSDTCAPRMRAEWTPENKTLGQCSITAFLMQDIFGGKVYGVPLGDGNYHCFNVVGDCVFDLTSEQFGNQKLDYDNCSEQDRSTHFAKAEKKERYEKLKAELQTALDRKL